MTAIAQAELLFPETALAIALLETGGFTDRNLMRTHNWFGFRPNGRGYQSGTKNHYAVYANAANALRDYQANELSVCQRNGITTEAAYRRWVYWHYAEDEEYQIKLVGVIKTIQDTYTSTF